MHIAMKQLKTTAATKKELEEFVTEVDILKVRKVDENSK